MVFTKFTILRFDVELQEGSTTIFPVLHQMELSMRRIVKDTKSKPLYIFMKLKQVLWVLNVIQILGTQPLHKEITQIFLCG